MAAKATKAPLKPAKIAQSTIRNRIVGHAMVKASTLKPHPNNPRTHPNSQRAAVTAALDEVGFVQEIIVNKRTGFMLNGHLRADIATDKDSLVPVAYVDLAPEEEKKMLAVLDATGGMALIDEERLSILLAELDLNADSVLNTMLTGLLDEAIAETPKPVAGSPIPAEGRTPRVGGDRKAQIKIVLYAPQVHKLEQALQLAGEMNRGKALMVVCDFYVAANAED